MRGMIELSKKDFEPAWWKVVCCIFQLDPETTDMISVPKEAVHVIRAPKCDAN